MKAGAAAAARTGSLQVGPEGGDDAASPRAGKRGRGLSAGAEGAYLQRDVYPRRDMGSLADADAAAARSMVTDTRAGAPSAGMLPASHSCSEECWKILTEEMVATIFQARMERSGSRRSKVASRLAEQFGVAPRTIRDIWNLRTWVSTTQPLWSTADFVRVRARAREREANNRSQSSHRCRHVEDLGGWKLCACWLVPEEELKRDEFDVVLDQILADAAETGMVARERKEKAAGASASSSVLLEARQAMGSDDAALPLPPAQSPARRHTPSYERTMANTRETATECGGRTTSGPQQPTTKKPTTPVLDRGGSGLSEAATECGCHCFTDADRPPPSECEAPKTPSTTTTLRRNT